MSVTKDRIEAQLKELERPSVLGAAIRAAGDPDMEWWNKGWNAAVKRMRAAFDGAPCINCEWSQADCEKRKCCADCNHSTSKPEAKS